jgi:hypothetical protein
MSTKSRIYLTIGIILVVVVGYVWKLTARSSYETAPYTVIETSGPFEIREYPDLMIVATDMEPENRNDDGSFARLFRFISGANGSDQKIAMTTPVFVERRDQSGQMGFVIPEGLRNEGIPEPTNENVHIRKRLGGRFAVVRFAGRMDEQSVATAEEQLRQWMKERGLTGDADVDRAGYDPPWTPGPFRRNEVLIRLRER